MLDEKACAEHHNPGLAEAIILSPAASPSAWLLTRQARAADADALSSFSIVATASVADLLVEFCRTFLRFSWLNAVDATLSVADKFSSSVVTCRSFFSGLLLALLFFFLLLHEFLELLPMHCDIFQGKVRLAQQVTPQLDEKIKIVLVNFLLWP